MGASQSALDGPSDTKDLHLNFQVGCDVAVEEVIIAAEKAGQEILKIYNGSSEDWNVEIKSDSSPVTVADKAADQVISASLVKVDPHIPIVSEETLLASYETRRKFQYFWLVDPLDGTKEFLKRNGQFTVNIALICKDTPIMGVVHVPCQGTTYWAVKGKGAYKRENGVQRRIKCAEFTMDDVGLKVVGSASHRTSEIDTFLGLLKQPSMQHLGSSLKLLMVAEGEAHIYPRFAPTTEWDTAAADVVVREAGGAVLQAGLCSSNGEPLEDWRDVLLKQQPLVYNKQNMLNPFFVVFGTRLGEGPAS